MIRSGKSSPHAWLRLDSSDIVSWAALNDISFQNVHIAKSPSHDGLGLIAKKDITRHDAALISVPRDMVLCDVRIRELAATDALLKELLKACEHWAVSSRSVILVFLLYQATLAYLKDAPPSGSWKTPFEDYLKFLPIPDLPTLWNQAELDPFRGTTFIPAVEAKLKSLRVEFDALRQSTKNIKWLETWWGPTAQVNPDLRAALQQLGLEESDVDMPDPEEDSLLQFEDWLILDAMYRSRAMEWPGVGDTMVPCIDLANHTVPANAEYEVRTGNSGDLLVKEGFIIKAGEEVLISYGDHKSAMEVLFSYGFWPTYDCSRSVLLQLPISPDDPFAPPKVAIVQKSRSVPGVRIYDDETVKWDSEALWLMILNEEDGLDFKVAAGENGERELYMTWKDAIVNLSDLKGVLQKDERWELFELRAVVTVLTQVHTHVNELQKYLPDDEDTKNGSEGRVNDIQILAEHLRESEGCLLLEASDLLTARRDGLMNSEVVKKYLDNLAAENARSIEEEDYS